MNVEHHDLAGEFPEQREKMPLMMDVTLEKLMNIMYFQKISSD